MKIKHKNFVASNQKRKAKPAKKLSSTRIDYLHFYSKKVACFIL